MQVEICSDLVFCMRQSLSRLGNLVRCDSKSSDSETGAFSSEKGFEIAASLGQNGTRAPL